MVRDEFVPQLRAKVKRLRKLIERAEEAGREAAKVESNIGRDPLGVTRHVLLTEYRTEIRILEEILR